MTAVPPAASAPVGSVRGDPPEICSSKHDATSYGVPRPSTSSASAPSSPPRSENGPSGRAASNGSQPADSNLTPGLRRNATSRSSAVLPTPASPPTNTPIPARQTPQHRDVARAPTAPHRAPGTRSVIRPQPWSREKTSTRRPPPTDYPSVAVSASSLMPYHTTTGDQTARGADADERGPRRLDRRVSTAAGSSPDWLRAPDCRFVSRLGRSRSDRSSRIGVRHTSGFVRASSRETGCDAGRARRQVANPVIASPISLRAMIMHWTGMIAVLLRPSSS